MVIYVYHGCQGTNRFIPRSPEPIPHRDLLLLRVAVHSLFRVHSTDDQVVYLSDPRRGRIAFGTPPSSGWRVGRWGGDSGFGAPVRMLPGSQRVGPPRVGMGAVGEVIGGCRWCLDGFRGFQTEVSVPFSSIVLSRFSIVHSLIFWASVMYI